jgi:hypothetical protein
VVRCGRDGGNRCSQIDSGPLYPCADRPDLFGSDNGWIEKSFASHRLRLSTAQMEESSIKRIIHACYKCGFGRAKKERQGSHLLRLCHSSDRLRLR